MIEIKRRPKIKRIPVKLSTELTRLFDIFAKPVDSSGFFGTKYSAGTQIIEITAKEMKSPLASNSLMAEGTNANIIDAIRPVIIKANAYARSGSISLASMAIPTEDNIPSPNPANAR